MTNETMNKRMIVPLAIAAVLLCLLLGFCVRKCNSSNMSGNTQTQPTQTSQGTDATSLGEVTPIDTTGGASGSKSDKDKSSTSDKNKDKDKSKDGTSGSNSSSNKNKNKNKNGTSSSGGSGTSSSGSGGSSGRSSGGSSSRGSDGSSSNGGGSNGSGSNGSSNNGGGNNNSSDNPTPTPHTHTPVTDDAVYATCQHVGLTEGSHCSTCGEVLQAQEEVPMRNHVYLDGECIWCGKPAPFGEGLIDELELPEDDFS